MKLHRIYAIILRYLYAFRRSYDRVTDTFYWPLIDLFLWGLTSAYFSATSHTGATFITTVISGVLLWIIVWRAQYEISVGLLTDLWDRNLINIFISPITFSEWLISFVILGVIKGFASLAFAATIAYFMYHVQILMYGVYLLPFFALLLLNGWWIGFFVAGLIIRYGTKIQTLAWTVAGLVIPFSGVFYPISILPHWAQNISWVLPTSYIFEDARQFATHGTINLNNLGISLVMSIAYVIITIWFIRQGMNKILQKGLVNLE